MANADVVPAAPPNNSNNLLAELAEVTTALALIKVAVSPALFQVCVILSGLLVVSLIVPSANPVMAVLLAMLTPNCVMPEIVPPVMDTALSACVAMVPRPSAVRAAAASAACMNVSIALEVVRLGIGQRESNQGLRK